jgi:hypothetical protein
MTPCWHMKALLAARADERLFGFFQRYLELHLSQCAQCRAALASLLALRARLVALRDVSPARLTAERERQVALRYEELLEGHRDDP